MKADTQEPARNPSTRWLFGNRIIERGLASQAQVAQALRLQAERSVRGVQQNLGEILVEQGVLTPEQVRAILDEREQIIMVCPGCGERYNVPRSAKDRAVCPIDGGLLATSIKAGDLGVAATLSTAVTPDDAPVGLEIGRCRIMEFLGKGGMGSVYKAKHLSLGRYVAVKMIPAASRDSTLIRSLLVEAQTIAKLEHPNVVQVYDVGYEKGYFFMVMQLLRGATLQDRLAAHGRPALPEALDLVRHVARGLDAAHARGIIHRDLKPSNIFVTEDDCVRLMDFGLARMAESKDEFGGLAVGTPGYMAPEQYGGQAVDARSDIYSLGAVFYLLVTGSRPFEGATVEEIREAQLKGRPKAPRSLNPDVSEGIQAVLAKMMARAPEKRYKSAADLLEDLDRVGRGEDPKAIIETGRFVKCDFCESLNHSKSARCEVCGEKLSAGPKVKLDLALRPGEFPCRGCGAPNPKGARTCSGCHKLFCPACGDRPLQKGVRCRCGAAPP